MKATVDIPVITLNQATANGKNAINKEVLPLFDIPEPTDNDVLSGRGVTTNKHAGNVNFRSLVALNKELYVTSTKKQKMAISRSIVEAVRSMNPPGRFLEKNADTGLWSDIGDRKAIEKTSQALRDGAAVLRKQLSEDLGDPEFLSVVFENDNSKSTNSDGSSASGSTSTKDGSNNTHDAAEMKKQQLAQQQQQSASCKPRLMKSRMAKKGNRISKTVPSATGVASATEAKKVPKKAKLDQVVPHVPESSTKSKMTPEKPALRAQPPAPQQQHKHFSGAFQVRSCSYDETTTPAAAAAPTKRPERSASSVPVTPSTNRTVVSSKAQVSYSSSAMEEDDFMEDEFNGPINPWLLAHSRNSSSSSTAMPYPPFFPMSPIGRHQHQQQPNKQVHQSQQQQHIFSCFQEPRGSGSNHSRPPTSPLHRSWSPRDFQAISPFSELRHERHSTGGVTSFADGDIDIPSLDLSFDRQFDRAFGHDDRSFSMDDDMNMSSHLSASRVRLRSSSNSSRSCTPQSNKDGMDDMDLHYSPRLDCDFTGNRNDLDDVIMKDCDYDDRGHRGLSPLSFTRSEGSDTALFDTLPDLLQLPIAPCGPYDKSSA